MKLVEGQLAHTALGILPGFLPLPGGEQGTHRPVLRPGDLLLAVPRRCGHTFRVGQIYQCLVPVHKTLGSAYSLRPILLSSFGQRLGEGRRTGGTRVSPSRPCLGGGSQGPLNAEWVGSGHHNCSGWILGICSRVDGSSIPILPPQYPKQLHHVVCVGLSCKSMVEAASVSSKSMVT